MATDIWWWRARNCWAMKIVHPITGRRKNVQLGPDETEARRRFHGKMLELLGNEDPRGNDPRIVQSPTLVELATAYFDWNERNRAPKTTATRRSYLAWVVDRYGHLPATDLVPAHVEEIKHRYRSRAPLSINHFVRITKGLYNWAIDQGILETNPVARVKGVPLPPAKRKAVSMLQAVRAYHAGDASPPLGDYMRLLLYTGMRRGELAGLPWDAYDAKERILVITNHKTAGRSGLPRIIPLSARAVEVIERQPKGTDAIISGPGGRVLPASALDQRWLHARPDGCRVTFHVMRHTFVSRLLARGVPEWEVQRLVGHSSKLMTRYYASADMRRLREAVSRL